MGQARCLRLQAGWNIKLRTEASISVQDAEIVITPCFYVLGEGRTLDHRPNGHTIVCSLNLGCRYSSSCQTQKTQIKLTEKEFIDSCD